jgi:hypothetical protein
MLWKTHIRISFEVMKRLGIPLSNLEASRLKEGVIEPDKWGDYPHHYRKEREIQNNLLLSRRYFLADDFPNAYHYLGIALHYIQDSYTSMASFYPSHHSWEESIEKCDVVFNLEETIQYSLRDNGFERSRCLELANVLSHEVQGKDITMYIATLSGHEVSQTYAKPIVDFNLGYRASYLVTKSVLSPTYNAQLDLALKQSLAYHETLLHNAESIFSAEIVEIAKQLEGLRSRRVSKSGIIVGIKNWVLTLRIEVKNYQLNSKYQKYVDKKHLSEISLRYEEATRVDVNPYIGWYKFSIPELNYNVVKSQLISLQEVAKYFMVDENVFDEMLRKNFFSIFSLGGKKFVRRIEINKIISLSLKNVSEYPN